MRFVPFLLALVAACAPSSKDMQEALRPKTAATVGVQYGQTNVVTLHSAVTSFPTPTTSGGGDISKWASGGVGPARVVLTFKANAATVIAGPIGAYEERADGTIALAGTLNSGADLIIPSAGIGVSFMTNLGPAKKVQVGAAATSGSATGWTSTPTNGATVTVTATPLYETSE